MKLKRSIAFLLLAVYLFAVGGQAGIVLSCKCVHLRAHVEACCCHCSQNAHSVAAGMSLKAPCCGNHHSTDIALYTGASPDNDRLAKRIVTELPPAIVAEAPVVADEPAVYEYVVERQTPFDGEVHLFSSGLRAPPVLV